MSVKTLNIKNGFVDMEINVDDEGFTIVVFSSEYAAIELDRSQAHMLMMYLQEHLGVKT